MGAGVVDGVESAGHVEKGEAASLGVHDLAGPWRYLLRLCDLHQLGHGMSSFQGDEVPDHFPAASERWVCSRFWMMKTRWVISSQRVLSSWQSSLASFRSLATSSLLALAESRAEVPASRSASASASVTATPKTFSSLRVSSFMACPLPPAEVPRYPPKRHCTGTTRSGTATRCASRSGPLPWSVPSLPPGPWTSRCAGPAICHWPGGKRCR